LRLVKVARLADDGSNPNAAEPAVDVDVITLAAHAGTPTIVTSTANTANTNAVFFI